MKKNLLAVFLIMPLYLIAQVDSQLKLWYDHPAEQWVEALPVGNGRLGAMIYGDPFHETIQLNENTIWAGGPNRNDNLAAKESLPKVRSLIFEGKYKEAQDMINSDYISKTSHGMPYQTAGNLRLSFKDHNDYSNYYRELDLTTAEAITRYSINEVNYQTRVFASYPDQVIIVRITTDKPGSISFTASMERPSEVEIHTSGKDELIMSGISGDHESVKGRVKFEARTKIQLSGGSIDATDTSLIVENANTATLYISIGSNFINYNDIGGNAGEKAKDYLEQALSKNFEEAVKDHVNDYQKYFNRVNFDLGINDSVKKPTNIRLKEFSEGNDQQLIALYFQFGRYLLISSSRPGGQPANLQGIWNDQLIPPWDSKYTVNINTEMNYWPSENTNLTEMNEPLIQMIHELSETGKQTARDMYGAQGWVMHHNTDIWRITGPIDGGFWGMWPMGGAWLSQHLFEKYLFNGDLEYLEGVYPVLREASVFYLDFLIEEPELGWLLVSPSISPENAPANHQGSSISAGTTMDNQLVFDLLNKTIMAAELLEKDKKLVAEMRETLDRLPPMQVGSWGQLQEWLYDWDREEDHHRHVSHLYGLYPSNQVSPYRNPILFDAAKTSLKARGDVSTGWSMGWKVNLWARLQDGNHANKLISDQLTLVDPSKSRFGGGTYPNLFDAHPPFQIDGNFGCTAGIAEMLLQHHDGAIHFLPALPDAWKNGEISGLRTYGGFEVSLKWENNEVQKITVLSTLGGNCRIRVPNQVGLEGACELMMAEGENPNPFFKLPGIKEPIIANEAEMETVKLIPTYVYDFQTKAGNTYTLVANEILKKSR